MNLAACGAARQREDFVMRLGCFLVTFAVLASLILEPPRAKAFAMTSSAVTALAGGFLSACGLTPVVSGMGSSEEVNESVARLIQEYLTAELPGGVADAVEWLGQVSLTVNKTGKIIIPALVAQKLGLFARWVAGKYGAKPGVNVVFSDQSITFANGQTFKCTIITEVTGVYNEHFILGSLLPCSGTSSDGFTRLDVPDSDFWFKCYRLGTHYGISLFKSNIRLLSFESSRSIVDGTFSFCVCPGRDWLSVGFVRLSNGKEVYVYNDSFNFIEEMGLSLSQLLTDIALSLDISDTMQQVVDRLTALEEGQSIALDVGATQSMEIQEILQGILDAILVGDLSASAEIVDTADVPVEPEEPDPPVVPVVPEGLDKLGAALTSRFPFSIPWDVYKGVTLLAAPPKAPYFEVDFMAPIADRVGGWKGSTKIVLDFSEYEIIGQVCRWTSTIGFCLMLASGTKRLIWTA